MVYLSLFLNILCIAICLTTVTLDNKAKRVPLLSLRNVFLFGFLYFQSFGFFSWLLDRKSNGWWAYLVKDKNYETSIMYGCMLNAFVLVFLLVYYLFKFKPRTEIQTKQLSPPKMMQMAFALTAIALGVWLIGQFGARHLMRFISTGIGVTATGFATWAWTSKMKDPAYIFLLFAVALANTTPQLTDFGRRGLVSLAAIIIWVVYYRVSFKISKVKLVTISVLLVIPMLTLVAAFSEARVQRPKSTLEALELMATADLERGFARLGTFQGSCPISIWCMENYPSPNEYRHAYTLGSFFWLFVPKAVWPDKPEGLGIAIPRLAGLKGVGGLNVGAGMIGHASAEGGWYALLLYSALIAILLKPLDTIVANKSSALYRIPIAAGLGDLFATARGEVNYFLDLMVIEIVSGFVVTLIVSRILFGRRKV